MATTLIGMDFSKDPAKTGLARATVDDACTAMVHDVLTASRRSSPTEIVAGWLRQVSQEETHALIALDAPLGWPDAMKGDPFTSHTASGPLDVSANQLFSRETDRQIRERLNKRPLEVGTDRIARTAHGTLRFLQELNGEINGTQALPFTLAWSPSDVRCRNCVIEVYPAATLIARGISAGNKIIDELRERGLSFNFDAEDIAGNDDEVDATVCVLAGLDFLAERAIPPEDNTLRQAEREGWILA